MLKVVLKGVYPSNFLLNLLDRLYIVCNLLVEFDFEVVEYVKFEEFTVDVLFDAYSPFSTIIFNIYSVFHSIIICFDSPS